MRAFRPTEAYGILQERTGTYGPQKHSVSVSDKRFANGKAAYWGNDEKGTRNHKRGEQNQNDKTQREKVM